MKPTGTTQIVFGSLWKGSINLTDSTAKLAHAVAKAWQFQGQQRLQRKNLVNR
jgi:hypothetical protein